nr:ATP-grasp domain-containing protein [Pararoseomonas indoligenes]
MLIEADGKALLARHGLAVPRAALVRAGEAAGFCLDGSGPWVVKAQVPAGGRGKAGGIVLCRTPEEVEVSLARLLGTTLRGHPVTACLVEEAVCGAAEHYLSLMVDPAGLGIRIAWSRAGGVEVESAAPPAACTTSPDEAAILAAAEEILATADPAERTALRGAVRDLARALLAEGLLLVEVNPLFIGSFGTLAGDAKVVLDLNLAEGQADLRALVLARPDAYPDAVRKLQEGFDYVELDPEGEVGLVTTGAGLSMVVVDEMTAAGLRPLNFCDLRTGQLRGDPTRLVRVLDWISARPSVCVVLVNIFAGITDLGEFGRLLSDALDRTGLRLPVVARLVGTGAAAGRAELARRHPGVIVEDDLLAAVARAATLCKP